MVQWVKKIKKYTDDSTWQKAIHAHLPIDRPVHDAIVAWFRVLQAVHDDQDDESQRNHEPQHDTEQYSTLNVALRDQILGASQVTPEKHVNQKHLTGVW